MSDRITRADVERIAETVTEGLPDGTKVYANGRNGYLGVDLYDSRGLIDTLHIGTKRDVYTYLQGMRRAQLLSQ